MIQVILLLVAVSALILHERLTRRPDGVARAAVRWALLGFVLVTAAVAGPALRLQVAALLNDPAMVPTVPFDSAGDPLGAKALAAQRPQHPFPSGAADAVSSWQEHIRAVLRDEQDLELTRGESVLSVPTDVLRTESVGTIRRTLIRYTSWDGTRIPAYVLAPDGVPKGAVLVVPGHGVGIGATAGLVEEYQHQAALALARRGYLTLTPELRGFGMLAPDGLPSHRVVAAAALAAGTSYKALVARDLHRALTVLEQWPGADRTRLAVVGTSLGGELAVLLAALDQRVKVTVSNSYGGVAGPVAEDDENNDEADQTPHGCHTMPGINRILLQEDWVRLVAPRPVLIVRGRGNLSSRAAAYQALVREAYRASGAADRFGFQVEDGAHEFYQEATAQFLERWL